MHVIAGIPKFNREYECMYFMCDCLCNCVCYVPTGTLGFIRSFLSLIIP